MCSHTVTGLTNNTEYTFEVFAVSEGLSGATGKNGAVVRINGTPEISISGKAVAKFPEVIRPQSEWPTFVARYEKSGSYTWSLSGDDHTHFRLEPENDTTAGYRELHFVKTSAPNFEQPGDKNTDRLYLVTLHAIPDGTGPRSQNRYMKPVVVEIENADDPGVVTLSNTDLHAGDRVTASLADVDRVKEETVTWQWFQVTYVNEGYNMLDPIPGATSATYTTDGGDVGFKLSAKANYMDEHIKPDKPEEIHDAYGQTDLVRGPVIQKATVPFAEGGSGTVHECVVHDADGNVTQASWSLDPERNLDEAAFSIATTGELAFVSPPDYENPTAVNPSEDTLPYRNMYAVKVWADVNGIRVSGTINVNVTDMDEDGVVTISPDPPIAGQQLRATLVDDDGITVEPYWTWDRQFSGTRGGSDPLTIEESSVFTPSQNFIGSHLQPTVRYSDRHGVKTVVGPMSSPVIYVPSEPRELTATAGNEVVDLSWIAPAKDNYSDISGYILRWGSVPATSDGSIPGDDEITWTTVNLGASITSHQVESLSNGTEYSFEVRAVNGAGAGASASVTATPERDTPGRVEWSTTQPQVGQELTPTLIDPDNPALAEARWRWRRQRWSRSDAGDSLSAPVPGSRSGESKLGVIARTRQYTPRVSDLHQWLWVEVTYTDDFDRHRVSATASRAVGPGPPCAPANLKAAPGDGQVTLTWEAGCNNGGTIDRYQYRRLDARKWVRVPGDGSARRQQVTGLTNGEAHTFEVRAGNRQEWGPAAQATATPAAAERTVSFAAAAYQASEGGEAATVTVRLSPSASEALRIPIAVNPPSGDFTVAGLTDGALSFSSGAERQTFTVAANQDDDWDDEEVTLGFGTPLPEGVSAGDPARATVTLFDDDDAPGEVTVRPATAQVGTELTATLSDADEVAEVTGWQWHRRASDQAAWTAILGATAAAYRPVSVDAGQYLQATVSYTDGHGPDKGAASAAIGPVTPRITSLTIAYGDSTYRAREGGSVTVTVRLSEAADQLLKIPVAIEADEGTEPTDFSDDLSNDTLSFTQHVTLQTFTITANEDDDTVDERVLLGFGDLPEGVVAGTPASATVTLVDGTGTVTLISTTPQVGRPLTAVLTDPDGGIHVNTWHWQWRARDTDEWERPPCRRPAIRG